MAGNIVQLGVTLDNGTSFLLRYPRQLPDGFLIQGSFCNERLHRQKIARGVSSMILLHPDLTGSRPLLGAEEGTALVCDEHGLTESPIWAWPPSAMAEQVPITPVGLWLTADRSFRFP